MSLRVLISFSLYWLTSLLFAQSKLDSLIHAIEATTDPTVKVDNLNRWSSLIRVTNPDSALMIAHLAENLARENNYLLGVADAKNASANANTELGNYYLAIQFFLEANHYFDSLSSKIGIATSLNNVGRLYSFLEDNDRALDYFNQSAVLFAELGDLSNEGNILNNIGYIYKSKSQFDTALTYLRKSLDRSFQLNNSETKVYPLYNIGSVYMKLNNPDSAFKYLNHAYTIADQAKNQYILSLTLIDLGLMHLKMNQIDKAETSLQKAYKIASNVGMRSEIRDASQYLSRLYEKQNEMYKALKYHKEFKATNDSLFNRDLARKIAFQEAEYQFNKEKISAEIARRNEELEQERILSNAIWTRNTLLVGLIMMTIISFLLFLNFKRKRKANKVLKDLNKQIESQAEELLKANHEITVMNNNLEIIVNRRTEELKAKNKKLKEYLSSNSHVVRAPVARILGLVQLYDPKGDNNYINFINQNIYDSANELDNILRDINSKLSNEDV